MRGAAIDPRAALLLMPALYWDSWRLLAGRFGDDLSAAPLALIGAIAAVPALRRIAAGRAEPVPLRPLSLGLAAYVALALWGPALLAAAAALISVLMLCRRIAGGGLNRAPLAGLALLALPVLPSLDFYLAYPMRLAGAALAASLLRLNGFAVGVDGVALSWNGSLLLFDAACSGIRMLWSSLLLVSGLALAIGFGPLAYMRALAIAAAIAVAGNSVRAASLFYVENGMAGRLQGPAAHEAVGLFAFALVAAAILLLTVPRKGRAT